MSTKSKNNSLNYFLGVVGFAILSFLGYKAYKKIITTIEVSKNEKDILKEIGSKSTDGKIDQNYNIKKINHEFFKTVDDVKAFQDWLDSNKPNWLFDGTNLNKDVKKGYGIYGKQTHAAWEKYKNEYLNYLNSQKNTESDKTPKEVMNVYTKYSATPLYSDPELKFIKYFMIKDYKLGRPLEYYKSESIFGDRIYAKFKIDKHHYWIPQNYLYYKKETISN